MDRKLHNTLDAAKPELLVWWVCLLKSTGHDIAYQFADWLDEQGYCEQAAAIREGHSPSCAMRYVMDINGITTDTRGEWYPRPQQPVTIASGQAGKATSNYLADRLDSLYS